MVVEVVSSRQEKVGLEGKMEGCQHLLNFFQGSQNIIGQIKFYVLPPGGQEGGGAGRGKDGGGGASIRSTC